MERHEHLPFPVYHSRCCQLIAIFPAKSILIRKIPSIRTYRPFHYRLSTFKLMDEKPISGKKGTGITCHHITVYHRFAHILRM